MKVMEFLLVLSLGGAMADFLWLHARTTILNIHIRETKINIKEPVLWRIDVHCEDNAELWHMFGFAKTPISVRSIWGNEASPIQYNLELCKYLVILKLLR